MDYNLTMFLIAVGGSLVIAAIAIWGSKYINQPEGHRTPLSHALVGFMLQRAQNRGCIPRKRVGQGRSLTRFKPNMI